MGSMNVSPRRRGGVRVLDLAAGLGVLIGAGVLAWVLMGKSPSPASATPAGSMTPQVATAETAEAVLASVQSLVRDGEGDRARVVLAEAARQYAGDQALRLAFADLLVSQEDTAGAYEQYEAALAIGPRTPEIEFAAGTMAHLNDDLDRAHEHFAAAQQEAPTNPDYALRLGAIQIARGELDAGKATLLRVGVMDPSQATAWGQLADVALRENDAELALDYIAKAREAQPEAVAWRVIEARSRKRMGDAQGAVDVLVGVAGNESDGATSSVVLRTLAESYGLLGEPIEAARLYASAAEASPRDAGLAREAATWFERAGDETRAEAWNQRAEMLGGGSN